MKYHLILSLCLLAAACGQRVESQQPTSFIPTAPPPIIQSNTDNSMPAMAMAHPNAKPLLYDEFFFDPIEETAPFGNDDGADAYVHFLQYRLGNPKGSLLECVKLLIDNWGYPKFDLYETDFHKLEPYLMHKDRAPRMLRGTDAIIVATAFGQLYKEGKMDKDIREFAQIAIKRQRDPQMMALLWEESYQPKRKADLRQLMDVLEDVP